MNKNSIIGFILIAAIMVGYTYWMSPSEEELAKRQFVADSIAQVQNQRILEMEMMAKAAEEEEKAEVLEKESVVIESPEYSDLQSKYDKFANAAAGEEQNFIIENDLLKLELSNKGGYIKTVELKDYKTYDSLPVILLDPNTTRFGLSFFSNNRIINTEQFYFQPSDNVTSHMVVSGDNSLQISMRLYAGGEEGALKTDSYIEYLYTIQGNNYMFDFTINMVGMDRIISANSSFMDLNWYADLRRQEKTVDQFNGSTIYYKFYKDEVDYMSESDNDEEQITTKLKWISYKQRFFTSSLVAKEAFDNGNLKVYEKENPGSDRYLKTMETDIELPVNLRGDASIPLSFYFGPNKFYTLKSYGLDLERQIPIGWGLFILAWINEFIVIPTFDWLGGYGWNYGIVILVLTIMLKLLLFPIAYKTYYSSAKMRVLKPEVDELSKKFPKKEDAMKKQQAVMALYKRAGANPAAGCVPMLLQMPILFAMFRFFPASIELRQQPFLWAHDLSSYDSIASLPFTIPFYGDHVSLFTLLMTVSTIMYTYMNNQMMASQTNQMPGMKTMMYLMPIMFLGIFNSYASGLSYYYFLANVITFGQMFVFRYAINENKLRLKIEENKKKPPKKKSAFQKRLEEAAKQRGQNQRR
ncbi:MAG: membrane protein insertase YidC [Lentimicrobiaceae bacterium]|jgi:YidC/Oxa1 family membrane protein insertase|nr:membrane protein insertase YidC [Lentimicrobiaceae bacterium]MCP4909659.1 membrane protein insertase YidC [Bacteroidota bacterium]MBT3454750.1 membrane protein insertase YidC [Lentimicrobiaceae bacterium]MBT3819646.1 membrane protein insertase YidC [Lentimicrobiaceae bacterium]MBT4061276.1 membrane protein insertase YidC [Lentimicrobiaceae bacterium]